MWLSLSWVVVIIVVVVVPPPDIRRALVDLPAAVQQKDSNGWQPLFWAVLNNSEEAVRLLIE